MKKSITHYLILSFMIFLLIPCYAEDDPCESQEDIIRNAESYNRTIILNGQTYYYYAQNSPEWAGMLSTEIKGDHHKFGESGCACSALANAIVNSVDQSSLVTIQDLILTPIRIDSKSLVRNRGLASRKRFLLSSEEDFFRYFPLCVANIAAGNNKIGSHAPRSTAIYSKMLDAFDINYCKTCEKYLCSYCLNNHDSSHESDAIENMNNQTLNNQLNQTKTEIADKRLNRSRCYNFRIGSFYALFRYIEI